MGFGLGGISKAFKKAFKGAGGFLDVTKPGSIGDILTFGTVSQIEADKQAKKAAKEANRMYADEIAAADTVSQNLIKEEEERKRKLALMGTQLPSTSKTGYLGVLSSPNLKKTFLSA